MNPTRLVEMASAFYESSVLYAASDLGFFARLAELGKADARTIAESCGLDRRGTRLLLDQATGQLGVKPGEVTPDGLFSIERVNCLGACALGPIVSENGSYHHHMTPAKFSKLIETLRNQKTEDNQNVQAQ